MVGISPERQAVRPWLNICPLLLLAAGFLLLPRISYGQSAVQSGTAGVRFQILNQKRVYFGQHSVTLNLVTTPIFPAPVPRPAPSPPGPLPVFEPSLDQMLFFSATVYDHQYSVLQWLDGNGGLVVVSNMDFNYFTTYAFSEIFMALDNESSADADPTTASWLAQARASLPTNTPGYVIVSGSATADDVLELNALDSYVTANSSDILQAYRHLQALNAAEALQLKLHPPVRPNTVINYWPIKSSVYLPGGNR